MNIMFLDGAWQDYLYWQKTDKKVLALDSCSLTETAKIALSRKRINQLIKDTQRTPFAGIGKPEPLKFDMSGLWSRRINQEHRLIYQVQDSYIVIVQCRYHY